MTAPERGRRWIGASVSESDLARLLASGPRRDFVELADRVHGVLVLQDAGGRTRGWRGRLTGPHLKLAWRLAGMARRGDVVFADGEHLGLPTALFLFLRLRRGVKLVMIGHFIGRPWKRPLTALATRVCPGGTLLLHSVVQHQRIRRWIARSWTVQRIPYQVDTAYWTDDGRAPSSPPVVLAVGSENRDYETLARAARGLAADVRIAAGSHWARDVATVQGLPDNVRYLDRTLPFADLREAYRDATLVAVPLHDVENQSGVTVLLEAMSVGRPVVVTATRGQRECVVGPLMRADGSLNPEPTRRRGPALVGGTNAGITGIYVPPGDAAALRAALQCLLLDTGLSSGLREDGRAAVERDFSVERYVELLAEAVGVAPDVGTAE